MTDKVNKVTGTEEIDTANKIIEQKDGIVTGANKELLATTTDNLRNFADGIGKDLLTRFWAIGEINPALNWEPEKLWNGNYVFNITKKGTDPRSDGQIRVLILQNGLLNVQLNPYSHYGEYSFIVRWIDSRWLEAQTQTCTSFLDDESAPESNIFEKEGLFDPEEDYAALLKGYGINADGERQNPMPPKTNA